MELHPRFELGKPDYKSGVLPLELAEQNHLAVETIRTAFQTSLGVSVQVGFKPTATVKKLARAGGLGPPSLAAGD